MGVQKFNCVPKFLQKWGFSARNFVCLEENFPAKKEIFRQVKIWRRAIAPLPPATTPLQTNVLELNRNLFVAF